MAVKKTKERSIREKKSSTVIFLHMEWVNKLGSKKFDGTRKKEIHLLIIKERKKKEGKKERERKKKEQENQNLSGC